MKDTSNSCLAQATPPIIVLEDRFPWYALRIQSRLTPLVQETLLRKGYETFLPSYTLRRRWSDRVKLVQVPLFPGYLFCRFNVCDTLPLLTAPGVIGIVGAGAVPVAIPEHEIAAARLILQSGLPAQNWPFLIVGSRVRIDRGPLRGLEGLLINADKVDRLVVSVTLLQRSLAVEIDRANVVPIAEKSASA